MSGEGIGSERLHGFNDTCSKRVKVDVAHQLLKVCIFLTENRFVSVLKQVPVTPMAAIEVYGITGEQPTHYSGNGCRSGPQQEVDVIFHNSPCIASRFRLFEQISKPIDEVVSVGVSLENRPPLDSTDDDVLQCSGGIYSGLARHDEEIPKLGS